MQLDTITLARFMDTPNRLEAAYQLRSRASQWAAHLTDTTELLAAMNLVRWADVNHANECGR